MAKLTKHIARLSGELFPLQINVNSSGTFSCKLPEFIAEAMNIHKGELSNSSLSVLCVEIDKTFRKYEQSEQTYKLWINIKYKACGEFTYKKNKEHGVMFGQSGSKYYINITFGDIDVLGFDYEIFYIKTVAGIETCCAADTEDTFGDKEREKVYKEVYGDRTFYLGGKINDRRRKDFTLIPYSVEAHNKLQMIRERMRDLSEMLFRFIDQSPEQVELFLKSNKQLSLPQ